MGGMGDDEDMGAEVVEKEQWSPWKESHPGRTRASLTPARYTPMRNGQSTDVSHVPRIRAIPTLNLQFGYPSASPFRVPASPSAPRQASGLARSGTTSRLRRDSTAASDISMDRESYRGVSRYQNGDQDERMSVDGNRREGSVLVSCLLLGLYART
jgi:nucleoporin NUP1